MTNAHKNTNIDTQTWKNKIHKNRHTRKQTNKKHTTKIPTNKHHLIRHNDKGGKVWCNDCKKKNANI